MIKVNYIFNLFGKWALVEGGSFHGLLGLGFSYLFIADDIQRKQLWEDQSTTTTLFVQPDQNGLGLLYSINCYN